MMISVDIPRETREQLEAIKARTGISLSLLIRQMVEAHLEKGDPITVAVGDGDA